MASDIKSSLYDPTGELSEDEVATGQRTAAGPFYRCHLKPELVAGYSCRTMMFGTMGDTFGGVDPDDIRTSETRPAGSEAEVR